MTPQLTFTINCGTLDKAALDLLPGLLARNPFGQCTHLADDSDEANEALQPYRPESLLKLLRARQQWNVTVSSQTPGNHVNADLVQRARGATFSITVEHPRLTSEYDGFLEYALVWVDALPKVSSGYCFDPTQGIAELHQRHGVSRPPACFTTHLRWVHFLAPSYYSLFLTTEDLLAAPAFKMDRAGQDLVLVRNYSNPFTGADPATLQRLAAIAQYLNAKDRFMKDP